MAFSRFILNKEEQTVKGGELVYALLRGRGTNLQVLFMAPVSVPRVAYNHTIGDLLSPPLHHCDAEDALCPACRTFGWVRGEEDEEGAYASRVRFTHANLLPETSKPQAPMRLAILGSPKPTTTRFYLVGPNGQPSDRPRSNDTVGYDGNHGNNLLRGRKMYRHHQPNEDQLHVDTMSDQNRTIKDAEGAGAVFSFTVKFENLAPVELGALLWALEVGGKGYHRLGYGKPLGLGSLKVSTAKVRLQDVAARYTSLDHTGWCEPLSETEQQTLVEHFQNAMITRYPSRARQRNRLEAFDALPNVQDILALVSRAEPSLPVHYPFSPDPNSKGQFEWFVGNNRQKGPKVELPLATEDQGLPLIDKRGNVHDHLKE